jgi:UDP-glucose:glycoprotein glucosyltransferase
VWNNLQGHWNQVLTFVLQGSDPGRVETFGLDHHYPGSQNNSLTVVLYGELGTQDFAEFHQVLKAYAVKGDIDYVLRHYVKVSTKRGSAMA